MSSVFTKNKRKRSRTTSNDTTSFVANVASKVSSLLPSTITKWFSSHATADANGSVPAAESEDSSTDDEGLEAAVVIPAKRMRFNTDHFNHIETANNNCTTNNFDITETTAAQARRHSGTFKSMQVNVSIANDVIKEKSETDIPRFKRTHSIFSKGQSVAAIRKSIFDSTNNVIPVKDKDENSTASAEKKPYVQPTHQGSTFYPGRTMYGGASSSHMNRANITHNAVAMVNKAKDVDDSAMSSSARRVMDMLEAYSSPLREARRLPLYARPNNRTQELYLPRQASILRLRQKSRLMDTTNAVRQIVASHSSSSNKPSNCLDVSMNSTVEKNCTDATNTSQSTARSQIENERSKTSFQSKVTQTHQENIGTFNTDTPLRLPSVILKIDQNKLPKFTLDTAAINLPVTTTPKADLPVTSTPKADLPVPKHSEPKKKTKDTELKTDSSSSIFIFAEPIKISCDNPNEDITPPSFIFDNPERDVTKNCDEQTATSVTDMNENNAESNDEILSNKGANWNCPNCWVPNKADVIECVCCAYKNVKPSKCTICKLADSQSKKELCVNCETMKVNCKSQASEKSSKWKCDSCWVMNDASANKCVCCGGTNLSNASKAEKAAEFAAIPKIRTKGIVLHFDSLITGDGSLAKIVKTQKSNKWECSSCLVMNESNNSMCVCCGTEKESKAKLPEVKFNFGTNTTTTFKFGIYPKLQEAKISTRPEIKSVPEVKLKEASETNNNILVETPAPIFTVPAKKEETVAGALVPKAKDTAGINFNFGVPKDVNALEKKSEPSTITEDKEKPQEVPQIQFGSGETSKSLCQLFGSPSIKQIEKNEPLIPAPILSSQTIEEKKDTPNNPIPQQVPISVEKSQPNTTFFPTLMPATSLFSVPSTATGGSTDTTTSAQTVAGNTSASPMFMMPTVTQPKSESVTSVASSLTKPLIAASMFSFGENATTNTTSIPASTVSSALATTDKPIFQFSLIGNSNTKTDAAPSLLSGSSNTQPVFNSPFGSKDETAKNTSTFGFNAGNALGTSSALPALGPNGLAANNGLAASNALTTNSVLTTNNSITANNSIPVNSGLTATGASNTLLGNQLGNQTISGNSLTSNNIGNTLTSNLFTTNNLTTGISVTSAPNLGINGGLPGNTISGGNSLQKSNILNSSTLTSPSPNIFGNTVQKDNIWNTNSNTPSANLFVPNKTAENIQKPPAFTFGTSGSFNMTNTPTPFGSNTQPSQNIFGIGNQNNKNQPLLFSSSIPNQTATPMFAAPAPQPASNPTTQMGMFGSQNISSVPAFGTANSSFEASSMAPAPAPAFNFGSPAPSTGFFGFGQQQTPAQPQQPSVYSFGGGAAPAAPQVQFAMGTAPNTAGRRLRKAVRRTTPR